MLTLVYLETPAKQTSSAAYHSLRHHADEIYSFNQSTKMYSTFLRSRQMHLLQIRKQLTVLIYLNSNSTNEPLAYLEFHKGGGTSQDAEGIEIQDAKGIEGEMPKASRR